MLLRRHHCADSAAFLLNYSRTFAPSPGQTVRKVHILFSVSRFKPSRNLPASSFVRETEMLWGNKLIWVFKGILLAAVFRAKHAKFIVSLNDFFIKVWTLAENSVMHRKVKTVIRAITDRITDLWIPLNPSKVWWLTYCICRSAIRSFIEVKVQILVMLNMVLMRQLRGWSEHKFISLCLHRVLPWMTGILFNKTFLCYFCWNGVFPEQIGSSVF